MNDENILMEAKAAVIVGIIFDGTIDWRNYKAAVEVEYQRIKNELDKLNNLRYE